MTVDGCYMYCILQKPMIEDTCKTSSISGYVVQINYTVSADLSNSDSSTTTIPADTMEILMSDYFQGHPMTITSYKIIVFALNEGGRSEPSEISSSEYYGIPMYIGVIKS